MIKKINLSSETRRIPSGVDFRPNWNVVAVIGIFLMAGIGVAFVEIHKESRSRIKSGRKKIIFTVLYFLYLILQLLISTYILKYSICHKLASEATEQSIVFWNKTHISHLLFVDERMFVEKKRIVLTLCHYTIRYVNAFILSYRRDTFCVRSGQLSGDSSENVSSLFSPFHRVKLTTRRGRETVKASSGPLMRAK